MTNPRNAPALLPQATVLGYFANFSTPTRVRLIAARAVLILGLLIVLVVLSLSAWTIWREARTLAFVRWVHGFPHLPPSITWADVVKACQQEAPAIGGLVLPGILLICLAAPIRQGRKVPSIAAGIGIMIAGYGAGLATALRVSTAMVYALGFGGRPDPAYWPWLLVLPPGVLAVLLLKDLWGFLFWIARNPSVDKPPVPFIGSPSHPPPGV